MLELIPQGANLPPSPPLYVKGDIYTDLKVFKAIDGHAIKVHGIIKGTRFIARICIVSLQEGLLRGAGECEIDVTPC